MRNNCEDCGGWGVTGWLWWTKPCAHCNGSGYEPAPEGARPLPPPPPPRSDRHILFPQYSKGTVEIMIQQGVITIGEIEHAAIRYRLANGLPLK